MAPDQRRVAVHFSAREWQLDHAPTTPSEAKSLAPPAGASRATAFRSASCPRARRSIRAARASRTAYLPAPAGRFGMVFEFVIRSRRPELVYLAFGVRHQPRGSHAPTVYEIAHRRLHGKPLGS